MYEKIWLAGLGAYARYEKLGKESRRFFDDLVDDGEDIRDRASDKLESIKEKAKETFSSNVGKLRSAFHIQTRPSDVQLLSQQIQELSAAVHELKLKAQPAPAGKSLGASSKGGKNRS
ncbi:hypothetical protein CI610_02357 [invertebrate metagenome]|uniref:Poly(Hydroxyalcanoate) granule associated protein (Phasin) n=1 Tax=invertebrate metagenome TaxID=1711999 RepID=A0A2H9T672_9ZZZZ